MKKKIISVTLILLLALTTVVGCEKKEDTHKIKENAKQTGAKKIEKEETFQSIGNKTDSSFEVKLTNNTEKDIIGISIKDSEETQYPANLLKDNDKLAKNETRIVYYTAKKNKETATESGKALPVEYTIQLTFADSSVSELHAFPFEDIEEGSINLENTLAYITYKSVDTKEELNTLEAEKAIQSQIEAQAQAEAAAAAQAQAEAEAAAAAQAQAEAEAAAAAQAQAEAEAAAAQAQAEAEAAEQQQPADMGEADSSQEDACLNDGLTF